MILLATIGLMLLVGSEELLTIFIGPRTNRAFPLHPHRLRQDAGNLGGGSAEIFLFGSTASAFTLFGLSFVYGLTGTTSLDEIGARLATTPVQPILLAAVVMTLIGFAFEDCRGAIPSLGPLTPTKERRSPAPRLSLPVPRSRPLSCLENLADRLCLRLHGNAGWHAMAGGWVPICDPRGSVDPDWKSSPRWCKETCAGCLPIPRWRMPVTRCLA